MANNGNKRIEYIERKAFALLCKVSAFVWLLRAYVLQLTQYVSRV
jgi:hypothetical protein